MFFLLNRILPFLLPVVYFSSFLIYPWWIDFWYLIFLTVVILDSVYFISLFIKVKDFKLIMGWLHSLIFLAIGVFYLFLFGGNTLAYIFMVLWCLIYLIYLESIFHFYYQTKKSFFIDLVSVLAYLNLVIVFFSVASFLNIYIFLEFSSWLIIIANLVIFFILIYNNLLLHQIDSKTILCYALGLAVIMTEILVSLMFLPISLYVSAFVMVIFYYLLNNLTVLSLKKKLNRVIIFQYLLFASAVLIIVLVTTRWL